MAVSSPFAIVNPCQKAWADLRGDGLQRFCDTCQTPVHAVQKYSEAEWTQVWRASTGRVCGLLCEESPPGLRSRRLVLIGTFLSAISPLMAQAGRVRIRVSDPTGAVMPTALGSLLGPDSKVVRTVQANEKGEIVLTDLPLGDSRFAIFAMGFRTRPLTVTIRNGDEALVETTLELGFVGEIVTVKRRPWWRRILR